MYSSIFLAAFLIVFFTTVVPNLKNYYNKFLEILSSILFIKVVIDSSSNVTSEKMTKILHKNIVNDKKIDFLSRNYLIKFNDGFIDDIFDRLAGWGLHVCYDEFLYFARVEGDGPWRMSNSYRNSEKAEYKYKITLYIPFWKRKEFVKNIKQEEVKYPYPVEYAWRGENCGAKKLPKPDVSNFVQEDLQNLITTLKEQIDSRSNINKYITLYGINNEQALQHAAHELDANIITFFDRDSECFNQGNFSWLINQYALKSDKPVIIYFNTTSSGYAHHSDMKEERDERVYSNFYNEIYQMQLVDNDVVFVLDGNGNYIAVEEEMESRYINDDGTPRYKRPNSFFFDRLKSNSKFIKVEKNVIIDSDTAVD